ncbi:MAG: hypothetical protein KDB23_15480 [Planctomycetales bacterium]|nr:hypothetical protein [Planctomycetales bacterium]
MLDAAGESKVCGTMSPQGWDPEAKTCCPATKRNGVPLRATPQSGDYY